MCLPYGYLGPESLSEGSGIVVSGVRSEESTLSDAGPSDDMGCEAVGA